MHSITHQRAANLVASTISGFLGISDVERYGEEIEPIIHLAAARPGGYSMLLDVSGCVIQSQEVVAAFQEHVARVPRARRCAVVTGSSMIRMQVKRIIAGPSMEIFTERNGALQWLCESALLTS